MKNSNINTGGISLFDLILVVNIVLKLINIINWSWWIVLWPLWIEIAILIIIIFIMKKYWRKS